MIHGQNNEMNRTTRTGKLGRLLCFFVLFGGHDIPASQAGTMLLPHFVFSWQIYAWQPNHPRMAQPSLCRSLSCVNVPVSSSCSLYETAIALQIAVVYKCNRCIVCSRSEPPSPHPTPVPALLIFRCECVYGLLFGTFRVGTTGAVA